MAVLIVVLIIGVLLAGLVVVGRRADTEMDPLDARLLEFAERDEEVSSLEDLEMSASFQERVIIPAYTKLAELAVNFTPENQMEEVKMKIDRAGLAGQIKPMTFFGQRLVLTVGLGGGAFFLLFFMTDWPTTRVFLGTAAGTYFGYQLPMMQLSGKIAKRQEVIIKFLPDALDLMVICVEAGLGFDQAMERVYQKWDNDLAVSFGRIIQEIQVGKTRRDSLRDMSERLDVPDFTTFAAAIIQADQLGVSIGKVLRIQSEQMRIKRRQRAQEKAQQAPVKMMIPMTFFIFPSIWVVLLGPSAIVVKNLGIF